ILEEAFRRGPVKAGPDDLFTLRAIKIYADGALGSRGAHLKAPYSDDPHNTGLVVTAMRDVEEISRKALAAGFQVSTHAIGDAANRDVLEAYARAGVTPAARFRIEHAQIVDLADIPRFAQLGIIASMQHPRHERHALGREARGPRTPRRRLRLASLSRRRGSPGVRERLPGGAQ
ncbi:MAG TPA: amidohydrolase family protein, partial [Myxococcaceae bacterium]|nr:amidohydrolase family protein [Myxococcaceae bacterium]